jgi:microtubule-associated protein-like 6
LFRTIVIGFKEGTVRIYDGNSLECRRTIKDRKEWISDIKFSPDNTFCAIGNHDNFIDVYTVSNWKRTKTFSGNSSFITHIDWSVDGQALQSNSGAYELLFWNINTGKQNAASAMKDERWFTWSCVLGWPVQGIWPPTADGSDINACARSQKDHQGGYRMLALGDDFSKVRVFRYPSLLKGSGSVEGRGHSSHVTGVEWMSQDAFIVSTGGEDNCVIQWNVK